MTDRRPKTGSKQQRSQRVEPRAGRPGLAPALTLCLALALSAGIGQARDTPKSPIGSDLVFELESDSILLAQLDSVEPGGAPTSSLGGVGATAAGGVGDAALVQALTALPLPRYVAPVANPTSSWSRSFGPVRSGKPATRIAVVAPADHTGLSLSTSPRLWWHLEGDTQHGIEVTLVDEAAIEPLLRVEIEGPHAAGHGMIDLSDHDLRLEPGVEYRWFVTLLVDRQRPSRNPISAGSIRVVGPSDSRHTGLADVPTSMRGHTLAERGVWYDAFDFFSGLAVEHPNVAGIERHRDRLMESATRE